MQRIDSCFRIMRRGMKYIWGGGGGGSKFGAE